MTGSDLLVGVVTGVVATVIWVLLIVAWRAWLRWHRFHVLSGSYLATRKLEDKPEPETVRIQARRNVLDVTFEGLPGGDFVKGEIVMSDELPTSGKGSYEHRKAGQQLWGFWDVQVRDSNTLLVHDIYAREHREYVVAFIWTRIPEVKP